MNPGQATITGRAAIQAHYEGLFTEMDAEAQIRPEATDVDGALGFDSGTFTNTVTPKAGGELMSEEGRYLVILRKEADGSWKVSREFGNRPIPPAMPDTGN
jgi:ketosteroid isomerase-like protein